MDSHGSSEAGSSDYHSGESGVNKAKMKANFQGAGTQSGVGGRSSTLRKSGTTDLSKPNNATLTSLFLSGEKDLNFGPSKTGKSMTSLSGFTRSETSMTQGSLKSTEEMLEDMAADLNFIQEPVDPIDVLPATLEMLRKRHEQAMIKAEEDRHKEMKTLRKQTSATNQVESRHSTHSHHSDMHKHLSRGASAASMQGHGFDDDRPEVAEKEKEELPSLNEYWKTFAPKLECWSPVSEQRQAQSKFIATWQKLKARGKASDDIVPYVVISPHPVGIRTDPMQTDASKTGLLLRTGECFLSNKSITDAGVKYLRVIDAESQPLGWVFEWKGETRVCEQLCDLEIGPWWYRVTCKEFAEVRKAPTLSDEARNSWVLCPLEVVVVDMRARLASNRFLLLADGRGWMFELSPPQGSSTWKVVMHECDETQDMKQGGEVPEVVKAHAAETCMNVVALETGSWKYRVGSDPIMAVGSSKYGNMLYPGELFIVDKRLPANGIPRYKVLQPNALIARIWLRLADGRGWTVEKDDDGVPAVNLENDATQHQPLSLTAPLVPGAGVDVDRTKSARASGNLVDQDDRLSSSEPWMTGFV